ncbi:MAG: hypothetical protein GY811_18365, partial [Myxococcales bacterium]|nr:hypothetical protein [Myxococcales bacterium]
MKTLALLSMLLSVITFSACGEYDDPNGESLCAVGEEAPTATLGKGVGSAFIPYEDNEEVGITPASQGGFGVPVLVRTAGLIAGES